MFSIAVYKSWLDRLPPVERDRLRATFSHLARQRDVLFIGGEQKSLPTEKPGHGWLVIGLENTPMRRDQIPITVGREDRRPGCAWVAEASFLLRLAQVEAGGGLERTLAGHDVETHAAHIRAGFAASFGALEKGKRAYVFGAKRLGTVVGQGLRARGSGVAAYLDNNVQGRHADGAPISTVTPELDRAIPVIIGTTRFPYTLTQQLTAAGFRHVIPYAAMTLLDCQAFPAEIPYIDTHQDIARHRHKYLSEFLNYADDRSRRVLEALLLYRLTLDSRVIQGHFEPESEQYFDRDLVCFGRDEVFVDAGGFDGQTTLNFIRRTGRSQRHVYYFEPDESLMQRSRMTLADEARVTFVQAGAYCRNDTLTFNTTGTTNGSISEAAGATGGVTIEVRCIDDIATRATTFIKMDIEGAEFDALRGAGKQIAMHAPRLAIAAYHKGADLWELGELIRDLNPTYRLGLRHYTESGLETVIYATHGQPTHSP